LIKAVREAKVHTEWLKADTAYEEAFVNFTEKILTPSADNRFLAAFAPFAGKIAYCGMFISLAQTLMKMVAPGIPDLYQGTELWDLSFVDPDNRRPVDFAARSRMLRTLKAGDGNDRSVLIRDLLANWEDGRIKLYLTHKLLSFRGAHRALFAEGDYMALKAAGEMGDRVCAFARRRGREWALAIVPRLIGDMLLRGATPLGAEIWGTTGLNLPPEVPTRWLDVVSGERLEASSETPVNFLSLRDIFKIFPVALLYHDGTADPRTTAKENSDAKTVQHIA
jgi:(1->4)-alpha-D-glucan 1-alpha-D-glucosylmutase